MEFHKAVELAKVYLGDYVTLRLNKYTYHYDRIAKLFSKLEIEFETDDKRYYKYGLNVGIGIDTNFEDLYIIVGLLKDLGLEYVYILGKDYDHEECNNIFIGGKLNKSESVAVDKPFRMGVKPEVFFSLPFGSHRDDYLEKVFGVLNLYQIEQNRDMNLGENEFEEGGYGDHSPRSSDHYNDNLDMDQQSPEFWDSI